MNAIRCRVSESGRLSLPADFRKAVGLAHGGEVVVELDGQEIKIRTIAEAIARAQAHAREVFGGRPDVSVDSFLAEKRQEAEKE